MIMLVNAYLTPHTIDTNIHAYKHTRAPATRVNHARSSCTFILESFTYWIC
eukprot:m.187882 g.187882  ORF g.187882 m.187882 type:complete len:51 (+) comp14784_c2_seq1:864-1016(+)